MYKTPNAVKIDRVNNKESSLAVKFHEIEEHSSQEIISDLASVGDTLEQMSWRCGWLVNDLYEQLLANNHPVDYLEVCYYASVVSLRGQRSMNTVKKWALTARFFSPRVAHKYGSDVLPFSHFVYAASFDDQKDQLGKLMWQRILEYSWSYYTNPVNGIARHLSVAELQEHFEGKPRKTRVHPATMTSFIPSTATALLPNELEQVVQDDLMVVRQAIAQFENVLRSLLPRISHSHPGIASGLAGVLNLLGKVKGTLSSREPTR